MRFIRFIGILAGAIALVFVTTSASATQSPRSTAVITGVAFTGSPVKPIITVTGRGLRVPPANPPYSPSDRPLCPKVIHGNPGRDYGTGFYLVAYQAGRLIWAAGRYRPSLGELDCIGLIVLSKSSTSLRLEFGAAYSQANFGYPHLVNGDTAQVVDAGAARHLVVHYS